METHYFYVQMTYGSHYAFEENCKKLNYTIEKLKYFIPYFYGTDSPGIGYKVTIPYNITIDEALIVIRRDKFIENLMLYENTVERFLLIKNTKYAESILHNAIQGNVIIVKENEDFILCSFGTFEGVSKQDFYTNFKEKAEEEKAKIRKYFKECKDIESLQPIELIW